MGVYIKGMGVISPQKTFDVTCLEQGFLPFNSNRMSCLEPDYSSFIDAKQIRRMSKVIKMGVTSSKIAMKDAAINTPGAVIVGTALGCLEDTAGFLTKMVQNKEEMLNPTPFIHSTHNTIASQIALISGCRGYNSTYSHLNISFESALTDAILLLKEGTVENVLVGGIDELTDTSFNILNRLGHYKRAEEAADGNLYNHPTRGAVGGEGASFFSLVNDPGNCYAEIKAVQTASFSKPEDVVEKSKAMFMKHGIDKPDILISGYNGDVEDDKIFDQVAAGLNMQEDVMKYKHLCGEFSTSTGFAVWMAATIIKQGTIPPVFLNELLLKNKEIKNILIHNQYKNVHHSLILLSAC